MNESRIKGKLFQYTLEYVAKKWGQNGLDVVSFASDKYLSERWYPFSDFCHLLSEICTKLASGDTSNISRMAREMAWNDRQWRTHFKGKDPNEVFISTKYQDDQYIVGKFDAEIVEEGQISVHMTPWIEDDHSIELWCEFYQGHVQGTLNLTGHKGKVEKTLHLEKEPKSCTFNIKWELTHGA